MQKRWFMSYLALKWFEGKPSIFYGSNVQTTDEHPVQIILRWNKSQRDEMFTLLSFQEVPGNISDLDVEIQIG